MDGLVSRYRACFDEQDGHSLLALLTADVQRHRDGAALLQQAAQGVHRAARGLPPEHVEVLSGHVDVLQAVAAGRLSEAYRAQEGLLVKFLEIFRAETAWLIPAVHLLCRDAGSLAARADAAAAAAGDDPEEHRREVAQRLERAFSYCYNDRTQGEDSKKPGSLYIVNLLFGIYFGLNQLRKCRNLINSVKKPSFPAFATLPRRDTVTYKFYAGRLAMFEDRYTDALEHLTYALQHCHVGAPRNQRRILQYLVPVQLLLGRLPAPALLARHELHEFQELVAAVRAGDLRQFTQAAARHQELFIAKGTYLILEKVKLVVYRRLCKRVFLVHGSPKLPLAKFVRAFEWMSETEAGAADAMDADEVEAVLANLIYRNLMRGYIAHDKRFVVLSAKNAFPELQAVLGR